MRIIISVSLYCLFASSANIYGDGEPCSATLDLDVSTRSENNFLEDK